MSLIWSQMVQIFCVLSENHLRYLWEKQILTLCNQRATFIFESSSLR
jgi:hypothetical protein